MTQNAVEKNRISANVELSYSIAGEMGADMPTSLNSANLPVTIASIPQGARSSPISRFINTVGAGVHIKTNIPATTAGWVLCKFYGDSERLVRAVDTQISFYHTAAGLATSTQMTMLNKGLEYNPFSTFVDTDNTLSIYLPHHEQRIRVFVEVYWGTTSTALNIDPGLTRAVDIIRVTNPITTGNQFVRCPLAGVSNTGTGPVGRTVTRFVATQDGTDERRGNSRANSCQTVAQALNLMGNTTTNGVLTINRYVAAQPPVYAATTNFAVGELTTGANGYVWRRRVSGAGTTPALTEAATAVWEFVRDAQTRLQPGCTWRGTYSTAAATTYALGDVVTFATGLPAPNNIITYVCIVAIAGNNNAHTRPSGTLAPNRNWCPIGLYNPVVPATITAAGFNTITINNTAPILKTIVLGNLTLTGSTSAIVTAPMAVSTFTANNCGSSNVSAVFHANSIAGHNTGSMAFTTTVTGSLISHTGTGLAAYRGALTVTTDNPTRVAISARHTEIIICGAAFLWGNNRGASAAGNVAATNTANAINPHDGGKIHFTGGTGTGNTTLTMGGWGGAYIYAGHGGEVRVNNRTLITQVSAPDMLAQPATLASRFAFRAETTGSIIRGQNLATLTLNGLTESRVTNGRLFNERNPQATTLL